MNFNKIPKLKIYILYIVLSNHSIYPMFSPAMRLNRSLPTTPWAKQFDQKNIIIKPAESQTPKATIEFSPKEQLSVFKKEESDSQKSATKPQNPTSIKPWYNRLNTNASFKPRLYTPKDRQLTQLPGTYLKVLKERYQGAPEKLLQDYIAQTLATRSDIPQWLHGITTKQTMTPQALKALDPLTVSIKFKQALEQYDTQSALPVENSQALTLQKQQPKVSTKKIKRDKFAKEQREQQNNITQPELSKQDSVKDLVSLKDPEQQQQEARVIGNKDVLEKKYALDTVLKKNEQESNVSKPTQKKDTDATQTSDTSSDKNFIPESMNFNELTNTQLMLKNLWKKGEIPTSDQVRKTLNAIWTNLSKSLKVNISDPIRNIFLKQAIETLPKDPIQSQGWIKSTLTNFVNWLLSVEKQACDKKAQEYKNKIKKDMTMEQEIEYFSIKNKWRRLDKSSTQELEMLCNVQNISIENIAQDFSKDIIQEIMGNRKLSASNMDNLNKEFINDVITMHEQRKELKPNFTEMGKQASENYKIFNDLGKFDINSNSSQKEIEQAYRKGALKVHPDKGGTTEDFQNFSSAYEKIIKSKESTHSNELTLPNLIEKLITAVKKLKQEQINEEKPLKDLALKNLPVNLNGENKISQIITSSVAEKNTNGTTTYRDQNQSITVNSDGKIVSMSNVVK